MLEEVITASYLIQMDASQADTENWIVAKRYTVHFVLAICNLIKTVDEIV